MRRSTLPLSALLPACLLLLVLPCMASAQPQPVESIRRLHAQLERTLSGDRIGNSWRDYLMLDELEQQLALGRQADPQSLAEIESRLARQHEVLSRDPYVELRENVSRWRADLQTDRHETLMTTIRQAKEQFSPPARRERTASLRSLRMQLIQMENYLATLGELREGWRRYLLLDTLVAQLQGANGAEVEALNRVAARCEKAEPMFRNAVCSQLLASLRQSIAVLSRSAVTRQEYESRLDALATSIGSYQTSPSQEGQQAMTEVLSWLERRELAPGLVEQVREMYSQPNLYLSVSDRLLGVGVEQRMDDSGPFVEVIRGTTYRGENRTVARTELGLVPDASRVAADLTFAARIESQSRGSNSGVTIWSRGTTHVSGHKLLSFSRDGFHLYPAIAEATAQSTITGIDTGRRRRGDQAARQEVYAGKAGTDYEVARRAENAFRTLVDRETAREIGPLQRQYLEEVRQPLLEAHAMPEEVRFHTTQNYAHLAITNAQDRSLGSVGRPPALASRGDVLVRAHESFFNAFLTELTAGETFHEQKLEERLTDLFGKVPAGLKIADSERLWAVSFVEEAPLSVHFVDSAMHITLRARGFTVGDKSYPGMQITAEYQLDKTPAGLQGRRTERLDIVPLDFTEDENLGVRQQVFRSMLRKRFDPIFSETLSLDRWMLPGAWKNAGQLEAIEFHASGGWLAISYVAEKFSAPKISSR